MRSRCFRILTLCVGAVLFFCAPSAVRAQFEGLPLRPGLWESSVTMGTRPMPPRQVCYNVKMKLDDWVKMAMQQKAPGTQCSSSIKPQGSRSFAYDATCNANGSNVVSHADIHMQDAEHITGTSHTVSTGAMAMTMDMTYNVKFISPDCGSVAPVVVAPAK